MKDMYKGRIINKMKDINYRGYVISFSDSDYINYEWSHESYDGAPDAEDYRCGHAESVEICMEEIDEDIINNEDGEAAC